ncbi:hypothetical protein [Pusillibacter faecalis]|uniref:hypothetical protein n=1 Tax=Pusillibacter faecalis TaxID=2714358 RepID=UPI0029435A01|nr:hypothetical protein [Pusillibacter faecalis]
MQIALTGDPKELADFFRKAVGAWEISIAPLNSKGEQHQLTEDEMPKYDFGVGLYGGYWPEGVEVQNPCCKCQRFGECRSPLMGSRFGRDCFIERDDQQQPEEE